MSTFTLRPKHLSGASPGMLRNIRDNPAIAHLESRVRHRVQALNERLSRNFLAVLIVRTTREMSDDDATHMAAGVAYYALFSLFPLLLGLTALMSFFLETGDVQSRLTDIASRYLPGSEELIDFNLEPVARLRGALAIFSILGLLWSGSAVFGAVNRAVNRAWDVHKDRPIYIGKPRQLLMALSVGILFFLSVGSATFVRVATRLTETDATGLGWLFDTVGRIAIQGLSFLLTLSIFLLIYKFMPNTKTYWRYIWPGAIVGAVLFESAKNLFITYVDRFSNFEHVYGSLAPVIGLLLWAYLSSLIVILGAELSSEYGRLRRGVGRGVLLHPSRPASGEGPD